ncbi:phosphoribosylaminoimidazole-succinocarboxamide synthase [Deltaproteobacteria bacterium]|nr:phosphoribosylaminoimidazole-succinocarboxamide synthase [Deltaproteobacteria bacterium]
MKIVSQTAIKEYPLLARGKVRDIYEIDPQTLLLVTTDRMSAFDVVMSRPIPYKGVVLNQLTLFWMEKFRHIIPNHLISANRADLPKNLQPYGDELEGRFALVKKAKPLLIECVVRGYITGSGWADYRKTGKVCGHSLPANLAESAMLETPLLTPASKAELGSHDENITESAAAEIVGDIYPQVRDAALAIYSAARTCAGERGIIIADTKFEFGLYQGELILIDEVLTPDSSRFWPLAGYEPGKGQPSFDKQYLRDWLQTQPWDMTPPPPVLPDEVVRETARRYGEAYKLLTGKDFGISL